MLKDSFRFRSISIFSTPNGLTIFKINRTEIILCNLITIIVRNAVKIPPGRNRHLHYIIEKSIHKKKKKGNKVF